MTESDDDIGDVVDAIERGNTIRSLTSLHQIQQARQAAERRSKAQQAEAARAEQIYLGAHCPWCHTSLTGTPAVCSACTRNITWLRLPLDAAVLKISRNLHTFKEVYRELLSASVVLDQRQNLVHVPLCSQREVAEARKKVGPLDEKLTSYIKFLGRVVERRQSVVAICPSCQSAVFERTLVPSTKSNQRVCPPCSIQMPDEGGCLFVVIRMICIFVLCGIINVAANDHDPNRSSYFEEMAVIVSVVTSSIWVLWETARRERREKESKSLSNKRGKLIAEAMIPEDPLTFRVGTIDSLVALIASKTKSLEELLKRIDEADCFRRVAQDQRDGREIATQTRPPVR